MGTHPVLGKDEKIGSRLLNARAETAADKPAFRGPLRTKRCLVPADGFYEWRTEPDGSRQPLRIVLRGGGIFSMAGLYETWTAPDGRRISTVTILTTEPNELMAPIHNRMPVILRPEDEALWLDRSVRDPEALRICTRRIRRPNSKRTRSEKRSARQGGRSVPDRAARQILRTGRLTI